MEIPVYCRDGSYFTIHVKKVILEKQSSYQKISVYDTEEFGICLFLDNIIQLSEKDHNIYDSFILKKMSKNDRKIIILGGGDGKIAETAIKMNPLLTITIVDIDRDVVEISRKYLNQKIFDDKRVNVIFDNALSFIKEIEKKDKDIDGIVVDLTDSPILPDGEVDNLYVELIPSLKNILKPGAWISIYTGDYPDVIKKMMHGRFHNIEEAHVLIPSFGENAIFIYGKK